MENEATVTTIQRGGQTRVLISQNRTVPKPIHDAALIVMEEITRRSEGMGRLDQMRTLVPLAEKLGCVVEMKVGSDTSYCPDRYSGGASGAICIDKFMAHVTKIRSLGHEIGHHLLFWREQFLYFPPALMRKLEELGKWEDVEELICLVLEDLILTLPSGIQWDGKLAVPRGNGTIRCFRNIHKALPSQRMPMSEIDRLLAEDMLND